MFRRFLALASGAVAFATTGAFAQAPTSPARATDAPGSVVYRSAFEGYRPYKEPQSQPWRASNEEAGALGGHVGQIRGTAPNESSNTRSSTTSPQASEAQPAVAPPSTPPGHAAPAHKAPGSPSHRGHR